MTRLLQYACAVLLLPAAQAVFSPAHGADAARGRKLYESGSPEKLIPGQKMGFSVTEADRTDIIEYLRASK